MFDLEHRTTGALESFNGVLGRSIPNHSNFFRFVHALRLQEQKKAYDVNVIVESGGGVGIKKKLLSEVRALRNYFKN